MDLIIKIFSFHLVYIFLYKSWESLVPIPYNTFKMIKFCENLKSSNLTQKCARVLILIVLSISTSFRFNSFFPDKIPAFSGLNNYYEDSFCFSSHIIFVQPKALFPLSCLFYKSEFN